MHIYLVKSIIITGLFISGIIPAEKEPIDGFWETNYQSALTKAKKENKVIMLYFAGTDWCKPCIILKKEVFDTEKFHQYAKDKIIPVKLDFPRLKKNQLPKEQVKQNEALAKRFNHEGAFPLVVYLSKEEKVIEKSGYRAGGVDEYLRYLNQVLDK